MHPHPLTAARGSPKPADREETCPLAPRSLHPHHSRQVPAKSQEPGACARAIRTESACLSCFPRPCWNCKALLSKSHDALVLSPRRSPTLLSFPIPSARSLETPLQVQPTLLYSQPPSKHSPSSLHSQQYWKCIDFHNKMYYNSYFSHYELD